MLTKFNIQEMKGFRIGNAENQEAATGVTVILAEEGAVCGLDIRGGAPASRESALLSPTMSNNGVHAVVLSGGSAYGLDSATGVMKYLEERHIGFPIGNGVVPIVCASCIFDLGVGIWDIRPDASMGYEACRNAEQGNYQDGNFGAGTGATVGKTSRLYKPMNSGIGSCAYRCGDLEVGAIVAVNAVGDVYDPYTGKKLAGLMDPDTHTFIDAEEMLYQSQAERSQGFTANTTIGAILTNANLSKADMNKVAQMAHDGFGRAIRPVHTTMDGDSIYALTTGHVEADLNTVGTLAAKAMQDAIVAAVFSTRPAYGLEATMQFMKSEEHK